MANPTQCNLNDLIDIITLKRGLKTASESCMDTYQSRAGEIWKNPQGLNYPFKGFTLEKYFLPHYSTSIKILLKYFEGRFQRKL